MVVDSVATVNLQFTAVRWTAAGGLVDLGAAAGLVNSEALAINAI